MSPVLLAFVYRINLSNRLAVKNLTQCCQNCSSAKHSVLHRRLINKILVANRGEIACRVLRSTRQLGIRSVAVYSDADKNSMHVSMADEAHHIGPAASILSYLNQQKIIDVAKKTGAEAIHPGYGFLSENAEFADLCASEGIIFIGPPASAIRDMGIKNTSKRIMSDADVPVIYGYHGDEQTDERLQMEADAIGYPVMIKAVRGGGGKGMRLSTSAEEFLENLSSARIEAMKAFANDDILLEKFVNTPRHVEVQIFGDQYDNYVYLFERDCSVQRRHQKIIEEAPAPGLSEDTRQALGEAAVRAARAVNYTGAGTVEFIMDKDENFYFMEMNTRLQVEHPITEMITSTDLVQWQIKVAAGEELPMRQSDLTRRGHSFEARIYAEDPQKNFMPGGGPLVYLSTPPVADDVRIDTAVQQGDEVSLHYDPLIAKLVVWAPDRNAALCKLRDALKQYHVVGLQTNIDFLTSLASHKEFQAGHVHTGFIDQHGSDLLVAPSLSQHALCQAAMAIVLTSQQRAAVVGDAHSPFSCSSGFRVNMTYTRKIQLKAADHDIDLLVDYERNGSYRVHVDNDSFIVNACLEETNGDTCDQQLNCSVDGTAHNVKIVYHDDTLYLMTVDGQHEVCTRQPAFISALNAMSSTHNTDTQAPMPGVIDKVSVQPGQTVKQGDALLVMIAMKMEYVIKAPRDGIVSRVLYNVGDTVSKGAALVLYDEAGT